MMLDIPLTIRSDRGGWWRIVRAEHDGRTWCETIGAHSIALCMSERLEPQSCVEGCESEILDIARGILSGHGAQHTRCAAEPTAGGDWLIYSPRNTDPARRVVVAKAWAEVLAREIVAKLAGLLAGSGPPAGADRLTARIEAKMGRRGDS